MAGTHLTARVFGPAIRSVNRCLVSLFFSQLTIFTRRYGGTSASQLLRVETMLPNVRASSRA
jgi:hypothetical protein